MQDFKIISDNPILLSTPTCFSPHFSSLWGWESTSISWIIHPSIYPSIQYLGPLNSISASTVVIVHDRLNILHHTHMFQVLRYPIPRNFHRTTLCDACKIGIVQSGKVATWTVDSASHISVNYPSIICHGALVCWGNPSSLFIGYNSIGTISDE